MIGHDSDSRRLSPAPEAGGGPLPRAGNHSTEIARLFEERFHEIFRTTSAGMVIGRPHSRRVSPGGGSDFVLWIPQ